MKKDIAIYSFKIAQNLIRRGYKLRNIELNSKIRNKVVFYFENNEATKEHLLEEHGIELKK